MNTMWRLLKKTNTKVIFGHRFFNPIYSSIEFRRLVEVLSIAMLIDNRSEYKWKRGLSGKLVMDQYVIFIKCLNNRAVSKTYAKFKFRLLKHYFPSVRFLMRIDRVPCQLREHLLSSTWNMTVSVAKWYQYVTLYAEISNHKFKGAQSKVLDFESGFRHVSNA